MSEKTLRTFRNAPNQLAKNRNHPANAVTVKIMHALSDTPAFRVVTVLSEMLFDATDQTTRSAILDARVQVLRARMSACRFGKRVTDATTLFELLGDKFPQTAPFNVVAESGASSAEAIEEEDEVIPMVQVRLLENYTHQGFDLPIGAVFAAPANDAELLVAQGVSEVFLAEAPINEGTAETARESEDIQTDDEAPTSDDNPVDPETTEDLKEDETDNA